MRKRYIDHSNVEVVLTCSRWQRVIGDLRYTQRDELSAESLAHMLPINALGTPDKLVMLTLAFDSVALATAIKLNETYGTPLVRVV